MKTNIKNKKNQLELNNDNNIFVILIHFFIYFDHNDCILGTNSIPNY